MVDIGPDPGGTNTITSIPAISLVVSRRTICSLAAVSKESNEKGSRRCHILPRNLNCKKQETHLSFHGVKPGEAELDGTWSRLQA